MRGDAQRPSRHISRQNDLSSRVGDIRRFGMSRGGTGPAQKCSGLALDGLVLLSVGGGDQLHEMAIGIVEVDAPAAIEVVDLAGLGVAGAGVDGDALLAQPLDARVELGVAHQKGPVLRTEIVAVGEVEGDAVIGLDGDEAAPRRRVGDAQDIVQEPGGGMLVPGRDDEVVELDGHAATGTSRSASISAWRSAARSSSSMGSSGGREAARSIRPSMTSCSFMRVYMSTMGSR